MQKIRKNIDIIISSSKTGGNIAGAGWAMDVDNRDNKGDSPGLYNDYEW